MEAILNLYLDLFLYTNDFKRYFLHIWDFQVFLGLSQGFSGFLTCKTPNSNTTSNFLWPYFAYPCGSPLCPGTFQTGDFKLVMSGQKACEDFGVWPIYYVRFRVDKIVKFVLVIFFYNCIYLTDRVFQIIWPTLYETFVWNIHIQIGNDIFTSFKLTSLENEGIFFQPFYVVN